jgi:hypothetical protein
MENKAASNPVHNKAMERVWSFTSTAIWVSALLYFFFASPLATILAEFVTR